MEILKNAKILNTICILLVTVHMLVLYALVFMTDKLDTRFGQSIVFQLTGALAEDRSCLQGSLFLWNYRGRLVRDLFGGSRIALVHEADIGRVAAVALTEDGHVGKVYTITGPKSLSVQDKVQIIREVIGRDIQLLRVLKKKNVCR